MCLKESSFDIVLLDGFFQKILHTLARVCWHELFCSVYSTPFINTVLLLHFQCTVFYSVLYISSNGARHHQAYIHSNMLLTFMSTVVVRLEHR